MTVSYDGVVKESHSVTYDNRGMIASESMLSNFEAATRTELTTSYTYDAIGRLTTSGRTTTVAQGTPETVNTSYTYDKVGNRLTMAEGSDSYAYTYNNKYELTAVNKNNFSFLAYQYSAKTGSRTKETKTDSDGSTVTDYTYDNANRLVGTSMVHTPSGGIAQSPVTTQNIYNGDGQRVRSTANSVDGYIKYYYSGSALMFTKDQYEQIQQAYVLDVSGQIIAANENLNSDVYEGYTFYNYDVRGSVTNVLATVKTTGNGLTAGQLIQAQGYTYDVFGKVTEARDDSLTSNEVKYTGAVSEEKTGLVYLNARHYDPNTGRFLQQDTYKGDAATPWTQHLYAYCGNNPVNMVDPSGHKARNVNLMMTDSGSSSRVSYPEPYAPHSGELFKDLITTSNNDLTEAGISPALIAISGVIALSDSPAIGPMDVVAGVLLTAGWIAAKVAADQAGAEMEAKIQAKTKANLARQYTVYHLEDPSTQETVYVGRTVNPDARRAAHRRDSTRSHLDFIPVYPGLSFSQARVLEQAEMIKYHTVNQGSPAANQINGISQRRASRYLPVLRGLGSYMDNVISNEVLNFFEGG